MDENDEGARAIPCKPGTHPRGREGLVSPPPTPSHGRKSYWGGVKLPETSTAVPAIRPRYSLWPHQWAHLRPS
eukprot:11451116-Karenia_brevis.AAC.1